ncbi:MAG: hypothetical protein ACI4P4_00865 [Faecousia sp.]
MRRKKKQEETIKVDGHTVTISYQSTDSPETMAFLQQLLSNQIDLEEKNQ